MKGLVISGKFGEICMRQKSSEKIELGELLVAETVGAKVIMQVYELLYGSQISQQNLELISGLKLEKNEESEFFDADLRNYTLSYLKPMITIYDNNAKLCKQLPSFFSEVRGIEKEDLSFLEKPKDSIFVGHLRSGSKVLKDVPIFLPGKDVFSHHILIPATTGRGKSLDYSEEVLIKHNNAFILKSIGEIVEKKKEYLGAQVISMNPVTFETQLKRITDFVRHNSPSYMFKIITQSGKEIMVTKDHNLHVLRNGKLNLLETQKITINDYLPVPLKIENVIDQREIDLYDLFKEVKKIYVLFCETFCKKIKSKAECIKILSKYYKKPIEKYNDLMLKRNKIQITLLEELLKEKLSYIDKKNLKLTDVSLSITLDAIYPLDNHFLEFLGYYIAEGYCLNDNSFRVSCCENLLRENYLENLNKLKLKYFIVKKGNNYDIGTSSSIFTTLIKALGIGTLSGNKRLPNFFLNLSDINLKIILKTYFEGDGGVDMEYKPNRRFKISTTTKSKKLANDIVLALSRFGILARCKRKFSRATNSNHKGDIYYRVAISGRDDLCKFLTHIGFKFARKNDKLKDKLDYKFNKNVDLIPINFDDFKIKRMSTKLSQKQFAQKINCSQQLLSRIELGQRRPSRSLMSKILSKFDEFSDFIKLLNFKWDKINSIRKIKYNKKYVYDLTVEDNHTFLAGHGGLFVHNSNLLSVMLWDIVDKDYCGVLVLDPHDEYFGRNKLGLKDHTHKERVVYYTSNNPPTGAISLKINLKNIKPYHFNGCVNFSDPQVQALQAYYREYGRNWIESILLDRPVQSNFFEATIAVVKRVLISLLDVDVNPTGIFPRGIFETAVGETTVKDICNELEQSNTVIIDTSSFSGSVEILIGSLISSEIFARYKSYKMDGSLIDKPVVSIVLEEAPRVLGKEVLERGSNIFSTIAREGRKFKIGLTAITQLPSLIPRQILANMNTKIILGIEMAPERQAIIDSASQDLTTDNRTIASLDKGEAIITSNFAKFAMPIKIPLFQDFAKQTKEDLNIKNDFSGIRLE